MIKAGVCGAAGKMGKMVISALLEKGHSIGAAFESENHPEIGQDAGSNVLKGKLNVEISSINKDNIKNIEGIIDFSNPKATLKLLEILKEIKKPVVIGTTGFAENEIKKIEEASEIIPVMFSPNMSLGVNALFKLTEIAAGILNKGYDIEVFEAHHRQKLDAPSGTAKKLLEILKAKLPGLKKDCEVYDRSIKKEKRSDNEVGVQVLRGGDIVGEHTVYFTGMGERVELTHRAWNRETFARGAVAALEFLVSRKPSLYNMYDVLGL